MTSLSPDTAVVVIGAGVAGLGAASALREAGIPSVVLEAAGRIGGRAWTTCPEALGGVWFDMGAVWLHWAERNPLVRIAEDAGETLLRSDEIRRERVSVGSREATPEEYADYAAAWDRYEKTADSLLNARPDAPLSLVADQLPGDPWALTVEAWEGPVICVAEANQLSLRDWRRNELSGSNLVPQGGIGAFVERRLGEGLDIRRNTPVRCVRWNGGGGRVAVETRRGTISAKAAIVTVSTGVLASGVLRFDPALPVQVVDAIEAMPMGLAMKVALRASGPDRLDLPLHCSVDRQVMRRGDPMVPLQCWPYGRDYIQGWIGGDIAWELARASDAAAIDYLLGQLRALFGTRVDQLFTGGRHLVTHWETDPFVRGAYSYARVGHSGARQALGQPHGDGHLLFAGEACHDGLAGTLAGAWLSGRHAAKQVALAVQRA